jgi:flagellar biosynthesis chaperone FliJ
MKISSLLLSLLVIVSTACSSGPSPVAEACSLVERARMDSASRLSSSPSRQSIEVVQKSMSAAHFAVSRLSSRQRRRLVADCDAVTGYAKGVYRGISHPAVASDLQAGEASIREALVALAAFEAAEKQFEAAEKRLVVEIEATCKALGDAKNTEVEGAESRLRDLNRAVKMLRERWSNEQLERFVDYCEVEVDQDWEADISALTPVAQTERERVLQAAREQQERAQALQEKKQREAAEAENRKNAEMLNVLVQMEAAWWSISRSDRATVCSMFRKDKIGTSRQWVALSGYGKPEYAFVFLLEACR